MNQNGWLALIICREKNLKSCNLQKQAFLANTQQQCFACCSKRIHQKALFWFIAKNVCQPSAWALESWKSWKHGKIEMFPFTFSKQTVWTRLSLTQSFNHGANITKQLFCFQLACKVRPKSQTRAQVALFCQQPQPSSQRARIWPHCISLSRKHLPPTNCMFFL